MKFPQHDPKHNSSSTTAEALHSKITGLLSEAPPKAGGCFVFSKCLNKNLQFCTLTILFTPCFCFLYSNINCREHDTSSFSIILLDSPCCWYILKISIQQPKPPFSGIQRKNLSCRQPEHKTFPVHLSSRCPAVLTALWNSKFLYNLKQIFQEQLTFFSFLPNFFLLFNCQRYQQCIFSCVPVYSRSLDSNLSDVCFLLKEDFCWHTATVLQGGEKTNFSLPWWSRSSFWSDSHILGMQYSTSWAIGMFCLLNWAEWYPETSKDLRRAFASIFH